MRIDSAFVVIAECIAFFGWLFSIKKSHPKKYWLFTAYLGYIALTECCNLFWGSTELSFTNTIIKNINVPLQFIFFIYYLLHNPNKKNLVLLTYILSSIIIITSYTEVNNYWVKSAYYNSITYGIGNIFLIIALIIGLYNFFTLKDVLHFQKTCFFWIVMGIVIYYIGSAPYKNFKNFFWSNTANYNLAYTLHYTSQIFNGIMYLSFAYASKCKIV